MDNQRTCKYIECNEDAHPSVGSYCIFHYNGGEIGNGETYEQYQVIEKDFIDFIKIIPMNDKDNLKVYSPVLRDIIIRCCIQIEIFFKEWGKFECSENEDSDLFKSYNLKDKNGNIRGAKNWNFRDYFYIKDRYLELRPIHIRELNVNLEPFKSWTTKENIPEWWNVYNSIKHDGIKSKKKVNLEIALESLTALFTLHCANHNSKNFLRQFSSITIENNGNKLDFRFGQITSPLDSKKYLFKDVYSSSGRSIKIDKSQKLNGRSRL